MADSEEWTVAAARARNRGRKTGAMTVGEVSGLTGISARTIRLWSREGLVSPPRAPNGYRAYTETEVEELRLVARARHVGLSVDECRGLLGWWRRAMPTGRHSARRWLAEAESACDGLRGLGRER